MTPREGAASRFTIIQSGLPAKITGIVFWGMVVVGLLAAGFLLHVQTSEQQARYDHDALLLTQRIADGLEQHPGALQAQGGYLEQAVAPLQKSLGFDAVKVSGPGGVVQYGHIQPAQYAVTHEMRLASTVEGQPAPRLRATVYFPDLAQAAASQRKDLMLAIGLVVIVFGLLLQLILQRLLSRPFASMVESAQRFADGDTAARIDERLGDEFSFLARFINRALDSLMRQQDELRAALVRATESEAELSREKEKAEVTLYSITDAVVTADDAGTVQYINPAAERLTGWSAKEGGGQPLEELIRLVHESSGEAIANPGLLCLQSNLVQTTTRHAVLLRRDGKQVAIEISAAPMRNSRGTIIGVVVAMQDVSRARRLTQQLSYQASHDALTDLYNRVKFEESLNDLLGSPRQEGQEHALLYLDLDQFKIVNDTSGHIAGDELLRQLARVMQEGIRKDDLLARLGGDEFGILLRQCSIEQARQISEKLLERIQAHRFFWQGKTFEVGASIGVVAITPRDSDLAVILSAADLACYAAKDTGRNRVHLYHEADADLAERSGDMHWVNHIVDTLNDNRFLLYSQPIRALSGVGGGCDHYELLLRMRAVDGSIIPPDSFIAAAERYNLMPKIDRWVIRNAFAALAAGEFGAPGAGRRMIAINLSGASLDDAQLPAYIRACAADCGVSFTEICFEITETIAIRNLANASRLINELRALGCHFALDDFGSGLSSFGYLKNLPVDYLKIDGAFVKDMVADPIDRGMVEAIHQVGQIMKISTIAEWVEDAATLEALKEIGVDFAQGYHIGRPQPIALHEQPAAAAHTA